MSEKVVKQNKTTAKATPAPKAVKAKKVDKTDVAPKQLVRAHARNLHIAPRKMRLVTNLVKNMRVNDAVTQLQFTNKKGAPMLVKLLQSAVANAEHNFSLNRDKLFVQTITCDMGPVLKRSFPRARGSAFMIRRKMSHVNVVLEERDVKLKKKRNPVMPKKAKAEPKIGEIETEEKFTTSPTEANLPSDKEITQVENLASEAPQAKEEHHGNESQNVKEHTSPQNLEK